MKGLYFAVVLVLLAEAYGKECRRNDVRCLDYTVVEKHSEHEERSYPSLVRIQATDTGKSKKDVTRNLIRQLYMYLGGANDKKETFDMVLPICTAKYVHEDYNTYVMSAPLLLKQGQDPPLSTNPNISVVSVPPVNYYVRSFSGVASADHVWDEQAAALTSAVNDGSLDSSFYYMCVYDSPWQLTNRLNEVWMVKTPNE